MKEADVKGDECAEEENFQQDKKLPQIYPRPVSVYILPLIKRFIQRSHNSVILKSRSHLTDTFLFLLHTLIVLSQHDLLWFHKNHINIQNFS